MKPFLMGQETEYSVSGRDGSTTLTPRDVHGLLLDALRQERLWLDDVAGGPGIYLENGARIYLDHGMHPEYASPECMTPAQVAVHDKAGERLLSLARDRVRRERPEAEITVLKNNLHPLYPDEITWGTHESYTCWIDPHRAVAPLLPHLVSRTVFAGAGCLSAFPAGIGFELSQRARHMVHVSGDDTTSDRALFCTRFRKVSDASVPGGWCRVHLISKDAQRAPFGVYLTYGTTGLLFLLLNAGHRVGAGLQLRSPLEALREISCDPWLRARVELADGRRMTALEIQQCYLEECERAVAGGDFPDWCDDLLRHWGETLAELGRDPLRLARRLDPYHKLFVYEHELKRAGATWGRLREGLEELALLRLEYPAAVVQALLAEDDRGLTGEELSRLRDARDWAGNSPGTLDRLRLAVRLQRFDFHYHELGGIHDQLSDAGRLEAVVLTPAEVERATFEAPPGGRAAARGDRVKDHRDGGWVCEWRYLYHGGTGEFVDLLNPFSGEARVRLWDSVCVDETDNPDLRDISYQIGGL